MEGKEGMEKYEALLTYLKQYEKLCVAFSGGADSSLLLKAATDALKPENVIAVAADTLFFSNEEMENAKKFAESLNVTLYTANINLLAIPQIANNEMNRCYHCKKTIFVDIAKTALYCGIKTIADGSINDDNTVYRPGNAALTELGIISPLKECGFYKADVRKTSEKLGLPTWNLPTNSCLATRFPIDTEITQEKIQTVEKAENYLKELGFEGVIRFRVHEDIARIEVDKTDIMKLASNPDLPGFIKSLGFRYVTLDLEGYRTGSMDDEV